MALSETLAMYAANTLMWLTPIYNIAWVVFLLFLLPLAIFKKTRAIAGTGMRIASYVFGMAAWLFGAMISLLLWGIWGVVVGLCLFGVGVVPVGCLAALVNGKWGLLLTLLISVGIAFGARFLGIYLLANYSQSQ